MSARQVKALIRSAPTGRGGTRPAHRPNVPLLPAPFWPHWENLPGLHFFSCSGRDSGAPKKDWIVSFLGGGGTAMAYGEGCVTKVGVESFDRLGGRGRFAISTHGRDFVQNN